jgi:hypothetical protein
MDDYKIIKREPLTQATLDMLFRTLRPIEAMVVRLGDTDLSKGAGVLADKRKCVWTKDGHRITFDMLGGHGIMASLSNEPDPEAVEVSA